jgi:hypothetical protein
MVQRFLVHLSSGMVGRRCATLSSAMCWAREPASSAVVTSSPHSTMRRVGVAQILLVVVV